MAIGLREEAAPLQLGSRGPKLQLSCRAEQSGPERYCSLRDKRSCLLSCTHGSRLDIIYFVFDALALINDCGSDPR